jgi:hypothetical protein
VFVITDSFRNSARKKKSSSLLTVLDFVAWLMGSVGFVHQSDFVQKQNKTRQ